MNTAIILAAGVGQRMRNGGLPKQFLKLNGKPLIIYTLEKFEQNVDIDSIIIVCHGNYIEYMEKLVAVYQIKKVAKVVVGGSDRQSSIKKGLDAIEVTSSSEEDVVVIHDGVRPLVTDNTIYENIRIAKQYGCAITVHPVTESVVVTDEENITIADFKKRAATYSMTAPQSFRYEIIAKQYENLQETSKDGVPLLDAAMVYSNSGGEVHMVKEQSPNIKITTPEDYYILKAILEMEEQKYIFGL